MLRVCTKPGSLSARVHCLPVSVLVSKLTKQQNQSYCISTFCFPLFWDQWIFGSRRTHCDGFQLRQEHLDAFCSMYLPFFVCLSVCSRSLVKIDSFNWDLWKKTIKHAHALKSVVPNVPRCLSHFDVHHVFCGQVGWFAPTDLGEVVLSVFVSQH